MTVLKKDQYSDLRNEKCIIGEIQKEKTHASLVVNLGQGNLQIVALGLVKVRSTINKGVVQLDTGEGELFKNLVSIILGC